MGKTTFKELAILLPKYIDQERLTQENPNITKEMLRSFFQELSGLKIEKKFLDACLSDKTNNQTVKKSNRILIIHTDGAARGNPGNAGIGIAIYDKDYNLVETLSRFIGNATNNVAEYQALIVAAQEAINAQAKNVLFKTDSELVVKQINGIYKVKNVNLIPLHQKLISLLHTIPKWELRHVRREENAFADTLANQGIDSHMTLR